MAVFAPTGTARRSTVSICRGWVEHSGGPAWFIIWSQNDGPLVHAVIDDQLVAVDAAPDLSNGGLGIAVDETGVVAVAHYRRVTFTDPTGASLDIVVDAGQCCLSRVAIALLAVGG